VAGEMPHHMLLTQRDFAKLVSMETRGEVTIDILEGKRDDIPVFAMPRMAAAGDVIQATAVPSFLLPAVPELQIFEIPYLFRDLSHVARYPGSEIAAEFSAMIESRYRVRVIGHFMVAHTVAITSTDRPVVLPEDFTGRHVNDDFESFAPMWADIKPATRYQIGYSDAVTGALHSEPLLDTSIGMLQNIYVQKQYTKFMHATIAPAFYTFFYTFIMNQETWSALTDDQRTGILRAADIMQKTAIDYEQSTANYHTALNASLGIEIHRQTTRERNAWQAEFSGKVRNGILAKFDNPQEALRMIAAIEAL
jgi:C4-dicarboxylate-binding protein DctP